MFSSHLEIGQESAFPNILASLLTTPCMLSELTYYWLQNNLNTCTSAIHCQAILASLICISGYSGILDPFCSLFQLQIASDFQLYFYIKSTDLEQTINGTYLQFYTKKTGASFMYPLNLKLQKVPLPCFFFEFILKYTKEKMVAISFKPWIPRVTLYLTFLSCHVLVCFYMFAVFS